MTPLYLPATIDGLVRDCSPCFDIEKPDVRGVIFGVVENGAATLLCVDDDGDAQAAHYPSCAGGLELLGLDLRNPTGRCHAAWWASPRNWVPIADDGVEFDRLCWAACVPPKKEDDYVCRENSLVE